MCLCLSLVVLWSICITRRWPFLHVIDSIHARRQMSVVSSINYISIFFPVKQRAETVIHSIMFVMQRRTTVFSIWKKFTISCSVASCQHTETNSVSIKVNLDRLPVLHCIAVSQLLCCSVAPANSTDWIIGHTNRLANEICLFPRLISYIRRMCLRVCERHEINAQEIANCFGAVIEDGCKQGG